MKQYNILFLCTHNSARSVLGEALASTHPSGLFVGYSAGSTPGTSVNPFARELALEMGYDESKLRSKSWDVYGLPDAPKMDFIVTVCDNAAGEQCPFGLANPLQHIGAFLIHHKQKARMTTRKEPLKMS